jgi:hypothetical protein
MILTALGIQRPVTELDGIRIEQKKDGSIVLWSKDSGLPLNRRQVKMIMCAVMGHT